MKYPPRDERQQRRRNGPVSEIGSRPGEHQQQQQSRRSCTKLQPTNLAIITNLPNARRSDFAGDPRQDGINDELARHYLFVPTHCEAPSETTRTLGTGNKYQHRPQQQQQRRQRDEMRRFSRLRGGGGGGGGLGTDQQFFRTDSDFTWFNHRYNNSEPPKTLGISDHRTTGVRLEGGGCCGDRRRFPSEPPRPGYPQQQQLPQRQVDPNAGTNNHCLGNKGNRDEGRMALETGNDYQPKKCSKKPCLGPDCMKKAFQEAQDFVDNIGKVPGLAGLGLVESPYFGAKKEPPPKPETKSGRKASTLHINDPESTRAQLPAKPLQHQIPKAEHQESQKRKSSVAIKENSHKPADPHQLPESPCGQARCKSRPKKTNLEPENEPNGGLKNKHHTNEMKRKRRSHSSPNVEKAKAKQFVDFGEEYPNSVYGHKDCNKLRPLVPANMGWMWNTLPPIGKLKARPGWRPGAISILMKDLLREAKEGFLDASPTKGSSGRRRRPGQKTNVGPGGKAKAGVEEEDDEIEYPPTLHIHRKDGVYYVTMYPIKQEDENPPKLDAPVNPLQFKIVKSKTSLASSSEASDLEIEFSPPAAVNRLKKKPNVVHVQTQVKHQEIINEIKQMTEAVKAGRGRGGRRS